MFCLEFDVGVIPEKQSSSRQGLVESSVVQLKDSKNSNTQVIS